MKDKINELSEKLSKLQGQNAKIGFEIDEIRVELLRLKVANHQNNKPDEDIQVSDDQLSSQDLLTDSIDEGTQAARETNGYFESRRQRKHELIENQRPEMAMQSAIPTTKAEINFEKIIGENLINKIGVLIIIVGVAIGAKYSIDNDLINPLTRIILGYASGIVLLLLGLKLKEKYANYSAVLVSGAMVIFYFITFFAFSFYALIGQEIAFALMVIFTIFTVLASLNYNRQVIAHIGLVGAIAVPFLLSDGSGNILFMYSYLFLIGVGVFVISLNKNWKLLFYSIFFLTWLIVSVGVLFNLDTEADNTLTTLIFVAAFFLLFYSIFVTYKWMNLEKYNTIDVIILIINSLIFYGLGYYIFDSILDMKSYLGLFTVMNAVIHFGVAKLINGKKLADRNLFYLVIGLVLVFVTISIPVQLDGNWVTMIWSCQAAVLFWLGRARSVSFYEYISYALMAIALFSLIQDWEFGYHIAYGEDLSNVMSSLINPIFLTSFITILSFAFINWLAQNSEYLRKVEINPDVLKLSKYGLPAMLIGIVYFTFYNEINYYFNIQFQSSFIDPPSEVSQNYKQSRDFSIQNFRVVWLINYTMVFFTGLLIFVRSKIKKVRIHQILIANAILILVLFLFVGLYELSELRKEYLNPNLSDTYYRGAYFILIRYISIGLFGILAWYTRVALEKYKGVKIVEKGTNIFFAIVILWILSSELIHWLDYMRISNSYGMGLSILWGVFSALIISLGIWKKKKHLRILGIAIFAVTLLKLFFYDLASLSSISKTVVLVSLGILLLGTSFLYNKYTVDEE